MKHAREMSVIREINQPITFAFTLKAVVALSCTSLLFVETVPAFDWMNDWKSDNVFELVLGASFLTTIVIVAAWDAPLAIMICIFLTCYMRVASQQGTKGTNVDSNQESQDGIIGDDPEFALPPLMFKHHIDSLPMAFTLGTKSHSTMVA